MIIARRSQWRADARANTSRQSIPFGVTVLDQRLLRRWRRRRRVERACARLRSIAARVDRFVFKPTPAVARTLTRSTWAFYAFVIVYIAIEALR